MPWQMDVAFVVGEQIGKDMPAYREVGVTVPRQSGKTVLQFAIALDRCINWPTPQRVAYTAQTGWDARRKMVDDIAPLLQRSKLAPFVEKVTRGAGNESILFRNGSRIDVLASTEEAGHGRTLDLAILDEAFADTDFRREQAALPAMATRAAAQMLVFSTAGTDASVFLKRKVDVGRAAVVEDPGEGVAYFEWSAEQDADPDDEDVWRGCMPALGHTINLETIRHARRTMTEGDFRRAYLNQWTGSDERVIPVSAWESACVADTAPSGGLVFAADATIDMGSASIAVADDSGRAELVAHHEGTGWVLERLVGLAKDHGARVVLDGLGTLGGWVDELEVAGVDVKKIGTREYAYSCAALFSNVLDGHVQIRPHVDLDHAVEIARKRKAADSWVWARQDASADISPLVAVTLALGEAFKGKKESVPLVAFGR